VYGGIVGFLFAPDIHFLGIYSTPELALILGNIFSYCVSPKQKLVLSLQEKVIVAPRMMDFLFLPNKPLNFKPGQYMEWTLPHPHTDSRGNRRNFTIASSPTEDMLHIGVKFYEPSSSFKKALRALEPGEHIMAGQLAGDFVLPKDSQQKLVFIAGGIGITPFRSMLRYLIDTDQTRDIVLLYLISDQLETSYQDELQDATGHGVRIVLVLSGKNPANDWSGRTGLLTTSLITDEISDYSQRIFFISGPLVMIESSQQILHSLGVKQSRIATDYFSGY